MCKMFFVMCKMYFIMCKMYFCYEENVFCYVQNIIRPVHYSIVMPLNEAAMYRGDKGKLEHRVSRNKGRIS